MEGAKFDQHYKKALPVKNVSEFNMRQTYGHGPMIERNSEVNFSENPHKFTHLLDNDGE